MDSLALDTIPPQFDLEQRCKNLRMKPIKSVSGIWFPTEESFESCRLCPREQCRGRRTPYDKNLFDRKYRKRTE